jgi:hypothetical protein
MMKRKLSLTAVLLTLLILPLFAITAAADSAVPTAQWSKTFGYATASCIAQTSDGNLLVAAQNTDGYQYLGHLAFHYNDLKGVLIKVDLSGRVLWNRSLPILPEAMFPCENESLIIAGETNTFFGYSETDTAKWPIHQSFATLIKIDDDGNVIWNKQYNLPKQPLQIPSENLSMSTDTGVSVSVLLATNDGGYLIGGGYRMEASAFAPWSVKPWLIKTDSSGSIVWSQVYGIENMNSSVAIGNALSSAAQTADGGYLLVGNINGLALTKTDPSGNITWSKIAVPNSTGQNYTSYRSVVSTGDGEYLLAGLKNYYTNSVTSSYACFTKLDSNYDQVSIVTYDSQELYGLAFRANSSDGYILSAYNYLVKTNFDGSVQWIGQYNGTIGALCATSDGGYAFAGLVDTGDFVHSSDIWVEKVSSVTPSPSVPEIPSGAFLVAAFVLSAVVAVAFKRHRQQILPAIL